MIRNRKKDKLEKTYYTIAEIAEILRLNKRTIWNWVKAKYIRAIKIRGNYIRIPQSELRRLVRLKC